MSEILNILTWLLIASVKYVLAVTPLLVKSSRIWYFDMLIVSTGGILGVLVFTLLGAIISKKLSKYKIFKSSFRKKRWILKIKNGYGLKGIAFITPLIISIPVGCMICASIESNKLEVVKIQTISVLFWSLLLFSIKGIFLS